MTELLTSYTLKELEAEAPAEESIPAPPTGRPLKIDQVDMFNDQGSLFSHVVQPADLT